MAFVGLQMAAAAKFNQTADGSEPTYTDGMIIGKMIQANVTKTYNTNPLYADDGAAEDDNSLRSLSVQLGVDDLSDEAKALLLGYKAHTGTGSTVEYYEETDESSEPVALAYIRERRKDGVTSHQVILTHKLLFTEDGEQASTKAESVTWQTPTITGRAARVVTDATGVGKYRRIWNFTGTGSLAAAQAKIKTLFSIS